MILVPVSLGELIDKITILKIKLNKISDITKHVNVENEYRLLSEILSKFNLDESNDLFIELYDLNLEFWEYHDYQREQWKTSLDENIINIELYKRNRYEHILNDKRAEIKKRINLQYKSEIVEEKQFISYNI